MFLSFLLLLYPGVSGQQQQYLNDDIYQQSHHQQQSGDIGDVDPVVIVPGIFGSQLDAKWNKTESPHYWCYKQNPTFTTLWLCFECMVPKVIDCWVDNMLLNYTGGTFVNRDGVESQTNDFGGTGGVECIDKNCYYPYFKAMIDGITAIPGYVKGVNLRAAPYDFRLVFEL
eukprot:sb/3472179/